MKTFYELLDTEIKIDFEVRLRPLYNLIPPSIKLDVNSEVLHHGRLYSEMKYTGKFNPKTHLDLQIDLYDKMYNRDSVSAVVIESFVVDGLEIKDQMTHRSTYTHDSAGQHDTVTDHIGWNGRWKFNAGMPFYHFKHLIKNRGWLLYPSK